MKFIITALVSSALAASATADFDSETYKCSMCMTTADVIKSKAAEKLSFKSACTSFFGEELCNHGIFSKVDASRLAMDQNSRDFCRKESLCPLEEPAYKSSAAPQTLDYRVSKVVGTKGYDQLRVSVVTNQTLESPYLSYSEQFRYRWTDMYLSSGVVTVPAGERKTINIAGTDIELYNPPQTEGVRGVIIGDPCFQSEWIICLYERSLDTFNHTIELLNAMNSHDDVHYYQILGDNFYDQEGDATASWFQALSLQSKNKLFSTVPGNHDFWVNSKPEWYVEADQLGNGFMQYYGIDTLAATETAPFDFRVNPDDKSPDDPDRGAYNIPDAKNFFYYNQIGNTAFFGYSGAHAYGEMKPYFVEACLWASEADNVDVVILGGHWHSEGSGCEEESVTAEVYQELKLIPECAPIAQKLKYFEGHKHCNQIMEEGVGYMVGGQGMTDLGCGGALGLPIVDTTGGTFKVYYFPIQNLKVGQSQNQYDQVLDCFKQSGVSQCYHLATKWTEMPF